MHNMVWTRQSHRRVRTTATSSMRCRSCTVYCALLDCTSTALLIVEVNPSRQYSCNMLIYTRPIIRCRLLAVLNFLILRSSSAPQSPACTNYGTLRIPSTLHRCCPPFRSAGHSSQPKQNTYPAAYTYRIVTLASPSQLRSATMIIISLISIVLVVFIPSSSYAYTRFNTTCTAPTTHVNFVSSPDTRGTLDIL